MHNHDRPAFPVSDEPWDMEAGLTKGEVAEIVCAAMIYAMRFRDKGPEDWLKESEIIKDEARELAFAIMEYGDEREEREKILADKERKNESESGQ